MGGEWYRYIYLSGKVLNRYHDEAYDRLKPRLLLCLEEWQKANVAATGNNVEKLRRDIAFNIEKNSRQQQEGSQYSAFWQDKPHLLVLIPALKNEKAATILAHFRFRYVDTAPSSSHGVLPEDAIRNLVIEEVSHPIIPEDIVQKILDFAFYRNDGSIQHLARNNDVVELPLTNKLFVVRCPRPYGGSILWVPNILSDFPKFGCQHWSKVGADPLYNLADSIMDVIPWHWRKHDEVFIEYEEYDGGY